MCLALGRIYIKSMKKSSIRMLMEPEWLATKVSILLNASRGWRAQSAAWTGLLVHEARYVDEHWLNHIAHNKS